MTALGVILARAGSKGLRDKCVRPLLDCVVAYLPSPADLPPIQGTVPKTDEVVERPPSDREPLAALMFKVAMDEW